jgi:hypothetical protein
LVSILLLISPSVLYHVDLWPAPTTPAATSLFNQNHVTYTYTFTVLLPGPLATALSPSCSLWCQDKRIFSDIDESGNPLLVTF